MTTFEVYRFSLWFSKNSIRWLLPKKCITSLLILTFLKFNEKRNIIHAHRNLISQFVPYEKSVRRCLNLKILQDAPKRTARLSNFWSVCVLSSAKNGHRSAAKMVIFKNIEKKPIPVTTFEVYRFSHWFYKQNARVLGTNARFWGRTRVRRIYLKRTVFGTQDPVARRARRHTGGTWRLVS